MKVTEGGKTYNVVIVGSPNVNPGYNLIHNDAYPQIAQDYQRMFDVLKILTLRYFSRRPWRLLRPGTKISAPESRRSEPIHRSRWLQKSS